MSATADPTPAGPAPLPGEPGLPAGPEWSFEVDWAGVPIAADVDEGVLTLRTADGRDVTARFPEFLPLARSVPDGLFVGEVVTLHAGVPSAVGAARRLRVAGAGRARAAARAHPAVLMLHDVLRLYGVGLAARTRAERRAVLGRLDLATTDRVRISPAYDDGAALLAGVTAQGLPGIVARRRDHPADPSAPHDPVAALSATADAVRLPAVREPDPAVVPERRAGAERRAGLEQRVGPTPGR